MYFSSPVQTANTLCALIVCAYAVWKNGRLERLVTMLIFIDWFVTPLLQNQEAFDHTQLRVFALDGVLTLALFCIALISSYYWPLWVTAFQVLELSIHLAMSVDSHVHAKAYFIGMELTSYIILVALAVGTWLEKGSRRGKTQARLGQS